MDYNKIEDAVFKKAIEIFKDGGNLVALSYRTSLVMMFQRNDLRRLLV